MSAEENSNSRDDSEKESERKRGFDLVLKAMDRFDIHSDRLKRQKKKPSKIRMR